MLKIIHYIPTIDRNWGGTTSYMQILANQLGKLTELHIFTHASENPVEIQNCQIHYLPNWKRLITMKQEFVRLINIIQPNIFHVNGCWIPSCALTQMWAQDMNIKVILTPHGMMEPWILARHYWTRKVPALLLYQKKALVKANCLHATAESEKENLLKLNYNTQIEVIPNGIEVENISLKKNWERKKNILFLSRIHVKKGIEFLLEAVAQLKDKLKDYNIYIAGEGNTEYINQLKHKAEEFGISDQVNFCGGVYGQNKWKLYQEADIFILPTYSENFGIVIAEAMASGTPVITTKGTPWSELIIEHCGWWTEIGTQPIIDAINSFLELSNEELEVMGKNGRKLIEKKYSSQTVAKNIVELYNKICGQK